MVVRAPLYVDPETAQITAKSDPIPTILRGIPLKLRSVAIQVDRKDFIRNPTNCEPMAISATLAASDGGAAKPTERFQARGCKNLPFKPKLALKLKGATKRIGHPALRAVLTAKPGEANIGRAQVNLPHGEFVDQGNLNKTCTRPVLLAGAPVPPPRSTATPRRGRRCPKSLSRGRSTWSAATATSCPPWSPN
ncbi:MAG TPA: hypothetical protein VHE08_07255 [Solirubrobacterales bacterium]|nr:hypothetical protein [Solirubrobacterales bacterium]